MDSGDEHGLLRLPEVTKLTGMTRSAIDAEERAGRFPRRISNGLRRVSWRKSEVLDHIAALQPKGAPQAPPKQPIAPELQAAIDSLNAAQANAEKAATDKARWRGYEADAYTAIRRAEENDVQITATKERLGDALFAERDGQVPAESPSDLRAELARLEAAKPDLDKAAADARFELPRLEKRRNDEDGKFNWAQQQEEVVRYQATTLLSQQETQAAMEGPGQKFRAAILASRAIAWVASQYRPSSALPLVRSVVPRDFVIDVEHIFGDNDRMALYAPTDAEINTAIADARTRLSELGLLPQE